MAEEIRLVGSFQDNITPKLRKLNREINTVTKSFTKMQAKLRPISKEMGRLAMSSDRVAQNFKLQRQSINATTQAMRSYTTASRKAAAQQRKMKPARFPTPAAPRGGGGGMVPGRGGGIGFGGMLGASVIGGVMTNAITAGFRMGVDLMQAPFIAFGNAFAERMGDEMDDIQSAGGMFALDKKAGGQLFGGDFAEARAMQERLNASLAKSAAALPGATNDYVKAARGVTDTVMMSFGKNEQAFKEFATELGAREGATSEEAITKVLSRFTEQTVLLGMGGSKGGMPLTMLMEQLVTQEGVNIQGMKRRYAQLRQNPLLATMLEDAEDEINAAGAGTAERMKAVMKALDAALPQQVVNAMRRSMEGLVEATRSAFFDPDTGLLGLSRKIKFQIDKNGPVIESSVFELMRNIAANLMVPLMELLNFLPQIFDPFANLMPILGKFKQKTDIFFKAFEGTTQFFEDEATNLFNMSETATDPAIQKKLRRQANMLKEQAGSRGALAALNGALAEMGLINKSEFEKNAKQLMNFDDMEFDFSGMATNMLKQFANSPLVAELVGTVGEVLGAIIGGIASALGGAMDSADGGGLMNKLIDSFIAGFQKGVGDVPVQKIIEDLMGKVIDAITNVTVNYVLPAILAAIIRVITATWNSSLLGKFLVLAGGLMAVIKVVQLFMALRAGIMAVQAAMAVFSASSAAATIAGWLGAVGPALASIGTYVTTVALPAIGAAFTAVGTFITGTALPAIGAAFTAIGTFITGTVMPALASFGSALMAAAAPFLAIVGAVLGLVAIFRHLDFIIDSVAASFQIFGAGFNMLLGQLQQAIGGLLQKFSFLGFGEAGKEMSEAGNARVAEAAETMRMAADRIAANTNASLARTQQDFTQIGNMIGLASDKQVAEAQNAAKAAHDTAQSVKEGSTNTVAAQGQTTAAVNNLGGELKNTTAAIQAAAAKTPTVKVVTVPSLSTPASSSYNGNTSRTMGLGAAIATEQKNKPAGSHLVIANSSEAVIPANTGYVPAGFGMGGGTTTINFNPTINANNMDADALANLMAAKVMEAVQEATYNEVYQS